MEKIEMSDSKMDKIVFDKEKAKQFRKIYNRAFLLNKQKFSFEGHMFLTSYAKYVLQYVESKFI